MNKQKQVKNIDLDIEECIDCGQEVIQLDNGFNAVCYDCGGSDELIYN